MEEKDPSIEVPLFHKATISTQPYFTKLSCPVIEARSDTMVYCHVQ